MKSINISVHGKVQGVFFRMTALTKAIELNLKGSVQNKADGSVYIEAEGENENLENFLSWCKIGPEKAIVSSVDVQEKSLRNFSAFLLKQ
ncbi:acylphosphatase [Peijinzhouia sedimentorum]